MKKLKLLLFLFLFISQLSIAQGNVVKKRIVIEAFQKSIYEREMNLTDDEMNKFWPVFQQMSAELRANNKIFNKLKMKAIEPLATDVELEGYLDKMLDLQQTQLDVKKKYYAEFKTVIPIKKLAFIYKADRTFKKELLQKIKERRDEAD
ncbi:MAG: hypothetical protein SGJ04_01965 [Bacteroidota bacterium]|nr:hypothetical protein [Bacteroidota bacterium]